MRCKASILNVSVSSCWDKKYFAVDFNDFFFRNLLFARKLRADNPESVMLYGRCIKVTFKYRPCVPMKRSQDLLVLRVWESPLPPLYMMLQHCKVKNRRIVIISMEYFTEYCSAGTFLSNFEISPRTFLHRFNPMRVAQSRDFKIRAWLNTRKKINMRDIENLKKKVPNKQYSDNK